MAIGVSPGRGAGLKFIKREQYSMSETPTANKKEAAKNVIQPCGLDVGTMNLVVARGNGTIDHNSATVSRIRNNYLHLDNPGDFEISRYSHVTIDGEIYILGEDAFSLANVFNKDVQRPMKGGLIAAGDLSGMDVIAVMVEKLVGRGNKKLPCVFSVPADPIDRAVNNSYHESFFSRILEKLDWVPVPLNEAMAVILSDLHDRAHTGIGISFGAGMTNVCIAYQGTIVKQFSVALGGDWIDQQSATMAGVAPNRMTALKENPGFSITNPSHKKRETLKQMEIIGDYYRALISNVARAIRQEFSAVTAQFPDPIVISVSGGTSLAAGFEESIFTQISDYEFPFEIEEVRVVGAGNQLYSVAKGCLAHAFKVMKTGN